MAGRQLQAPASMMRMLELGQHWIDMRQFIFLIMS
uniref:Uncharacterized protein n=1 Tax=Arundo donax TaxID=35708 RepID=A0A0A8YW26_ARUDO